MGDIDDIKKLSPEERIKRLKKLEEDRRKEIEEAENLVRQSEAEIEAGEKLREQIPIPQVTAADIGELSSHEEKQLFATKRYEDSRVRSEESQEKAEKKPGKKPELEEMVWKEAPKLTEEQLAEQRSYGEHLAQQMTVSQISGEIYSINQQAGEIGYMSQELQERKTAMVYAALEKARERDEGSYRPAKASDETLSRLVQAYKR